MKLYSQHLAPHERAPEADPSPMVEMNTTPLIDVMLVLVVMLIITIPVQLHSVNLDTPSYQVSSATPEVVALQMDAAGYVYWNGERVIDMSVLNTHIAAAARAPVQPEIHLRPSSDTPYAFVAAFLVLAKRGGLQKVGVVN